MSQGPTPEELERRYGQWSTEALIEAVTRLGVPTPDRGDSRVATVLVVGLADG